MSTYLSKTPGKKPITISEQAMLLVGILFARKQLDEIFDVLPDEQVIHLAPAKKKFLSMPQQERINQIILELRRLLLISRTGINNIHQTWVDDFLSREPDYLRPIIRKLLSDIFESPNDLRSSKIGHFSANQILHSFLPSLNHNPKVALHDPILIRLQSIYNYDQIHIFSGLGIHVLGATSKCVNKARLEKFLPQLEQVHEKVALNLTEDENPFFLSENKQFIVELLIRKKTYCLEDLTIECGIAALALYLSTHTKKWQKTIGFSLERHLGLQLFAALKSIVNTPKKRAPLEALLNASFDITFV